MVKMLNAQVNEKFISNNTSAFITARKEYCFVKFTNSQYNFVHKNMKICTNHFAFCFYIYKLSIITKPKFLGILFLILKKYLFQLEKLNY